MDCKCDIERKKERKKERTKERKKERKREREREKERKREKEKERVGRLPMEQSVQYVQYSTVCAFGLSI